MAVIGEACIVIQWPNIIDRTINRQVHILAAITRDKNIKGVIDIIPAYSSLTVLIDLRQFTKHNNKFPREYFVEWLQGLDLSAPENGKVETVIEIPVCYDAALNNDLEWLSAKHEIEIAEIIRLHTSSSYYVYMLGFLPGFSYMGEVDDSIAFPRKDKPVAVKAGSVAIAGKQTGIYPVDSPGGWNIIGYTPIKVFDAAKEKPCLLEPGATVIFRSIDIETYHSIKNSLLP